MKIAISGAGVAGPALAHWLLRAGHAPTLIERSPTLRTGGYMIDFWGVGYDVAERMGLLPQILEAGYRFREVRLLDSRGRRAGGFSADVFVKATKGRFTSLPRGDLAAILYRSVEGRAEALFDESIEGLEDGPDGVEVRLRRGGTRQFDLVVGADGLHSAVRGLAFGRQEGFEVQLDYRVASFAIQDYRPRDELTYIGAAAPGRQMARIALRDDWTMVLLVFRADLIPGEEPEDKKGRQALLRQVFGDAGWEAPQLLAAMDGADSLYYDRVSQIHMPAWTNGRVALVGDAAAAVSLMAGEGTGLGMTEAYVLAGELHKAGGDHAAAFQRYEARLRSFIEAKQKAARGFAASFAPRTAAGVWLRNQVSRLLALPGVARLLIGQTVHDDFELPEYGL